MAEEMIACIKTVIMIHSNETKTIHIPIRIKKNRRLTFDAPAKVTAVFHGWEVISVPLAPGVTEVLTSLSLLVVIKANNVCTTFPFVLGFGADF